MRPRRKQRRRGGGYSPPPAARIHPNPTAIDPDRDWQVREWQRGDGTPAPHVLRDGDIAIIATPFDPSEASRGIRLHELAHVKWTPAEVSMEGLHPMTVNAVEDCRIHKRLREQSFERPAVLSPQDWQHYRRKMPGMSPLEVSRFVAASLNTGDEGTMREVATDSGHGWVLPIIDGMYDRHMRPRRPAWRRTIDMGREMEAVFMPPPPPDPSDMLPGMFVAGDADLDEVEANYRRDYWPGIGSDPCPGWSDMSESHPPLTLPLPRSMQAGRRNRATDTGSVPRYWHRLPVDGRVFARRVKTSGGGSVLIDMSGSMNLDASQVALIMVGMPGCIIAGYSGDDSTGQLRILARDGKRVADTHLEPAYGGNGVDGPALAWLATQPGPRYWVSDGQVFGRESSAHPALLMEVRETCRRGRIARVKSADAFIGALRDSGALPEGVTL